MIRVQGAFELFGIVGFLIGFFGHIPALMIAAGLTMVLDDLYQIHSGILSPIFPALATIFFVVVLEPWYVGVLWAAAMLRPLNIPTSLLKLFSPGSVLARVRLAECDGA